MAAATEWLNKHVPAAMDTNATIQVLLETGFPTVIRARGYKQGARLELSQLVCEEKT
jgi:hypothetical protein